MLHVTEIDRHEGGLLPREKGWKEECYRETDLREDCYRKKQAGLKSVSEKQVLGISGSEIDRLEGVL